MSANQSFHKAQIKATLRRAAEIIEQTGWTQGYYSKDKEGRRVLPTSPSASCFCALGAIRRADFVLGNDCGIGEAVCAVFNTLRADGFTLGGKPGQSGSLVAAYNDTEGRTKEEVCSLLLRSIERVQ